MALVNQGSTQYGRKNYKMQVKWNTLSMIIILNGFETDIDILPSNCITTMEENNVLISLNMEKVKTLNESGHY